MGSSRTPVCRMKTNLRLTPLTLSSLVLGYGTRAHPLGLNLMSTHFLGHQSSGLGFAISLSGKPKTHGWRIVRRVLSYIILTFWTIGWYSTASQNYSAKRQLLLSLPFLSSSFRALHIGTKGGVCRFGKSPKVLAMLMLQLLCSFQPFCFFLLLSVHASTKT
ncbi:hypothetical protein H5410_060001 [Solanum commersonii]|uniref:Uncharacterized protein n=1 Tax=Solanum commersonii TaxID=4109 RepID=A0A9J5W3X1_SOLCO|nr:hypothetical protein H5410_060001 [Solanum commersonii]